MGKVQIHWNDEGAPLIPGTAANDTPHVLMRASGTFDSNRKAFTEMSRMVMNCDTLARQSDDPHTRKALAALSDLAGRLAADIANRLKDAKDGD